MGRPRAFNYKTIDQYNVLHTDKTRMIQGVEMTTLYLLKETAKFFNSTAVWAYCASETKFKKDGFTPSVNIPVITDQKTIDFLDKKAWHDWVDKETKNGRTDYPEAVEFLSRVFPDHKKVFFYELDSIISCWTRGVLESYDKDGNLKPARENDMKSRKRLNRKYKGSLNGDLSVEDYPQEIQDLYNKYRAVWEEEPKDVKKVMGAYGAFADAEGNYLYEKHNCCDVFLQIGRNSVCFPVGFSDGTADWHKEQYGKVCAYAHAGEIFFVVTPDTIYFEIKRHY